MFQVKLDEVMKARGVTNEKLASLVGTRPNYISVLRQSHKLPGILMALKIARALKTDPRRIWFLGDGIRKPAA